MEGRIDVYHRIIRIINILDQIENDGSEIECGYGSDVDVDIRLIS